MNDIAKLYLRLKTMSFMKSQNNVWLIIAIIVIAASSRLLPNSIANFSAVGAIAFMSGALFSNKVLKYLVPVAILALSDIALNLLVYSDFTNGSLLYDGMMWVYAPFLISVFLGQKILRKLNALRVFGTAIASGIVFFLLSNLGVWLSGGLYPMSLSGLFECYAMGIPFFRSTLMGNLVFGFFIYGAYAFAVSQLKSKTAID